MFIWINDRRQIQLIERENKKAGKICFFSVFFCVIFYFYMMGYDGFFFIFAMR